jgi:glycosyltransferase involved in cell wall biosynthesis
VWQGLPFVVDALGMLDSSVHLLLVGDGPMREELERQSDHLGLGSRVHIAGRVPHASVPGYIAASHICLNYPLRLRANGASPFKVYEYLACGRPVVSANLPGLREDFGGAVAWCDPESPESLAAAVSALLADPIRMAALEGSGVEFVEGAHTWPIVAHEISEACLRAIGSSQSVPGDA